jgi:hypothetical protein
MRYMRGRPDTDNADETRWMHANKAVDLAKIAALLCAA